MAKAHLNRLAEGLVSGSGECIGLPILRPGTTILLDGLGRRFSKTYYVEKTSHSVGTSGYRTTFSIRDNSI
jgi:phage protein D